MASRASADSRSDAPEAEAGGADAQARVDAAAPSARWLGAFTLDEGARPFEALTAGKLRANLDFSDWANSKTSGFQFTAASIADDSDAGAVTIMTWQPDDTIENVLAGRYDAYVDQWAADAKADGHRFLLRFAHEANGNWYAWAYGGSPPASTPALYAQMWRHVHDIFALRQVANVFWVYSPNTVEPTGGLTADFVAAYPGDDYVDFVALDAYNFSSVQAGGTWRSFDDLFHHSYDLMTGLTAKPLFVGETSSAEVGGDKGQWITDAFGIIPVAMPRIAGVVWFNVDKETAWQVGSSPGSLAAFRQVAADRAWNGPFTWK